MAAVGLSANADDEVEEPPFRIDWTFAGGGLAAWGQCTDLGTVPREWLYVELWEEGFLVRVDVPKGAEVPCLHSHLPEPHAVEFFGELSDGDGAVHFPSIDGRWVVFASVDGMPAMEVGEIGFEPAPGGALRLVWDDAWMEHAEGLRYLSVTLSPQDAPEHTGDDDEKGGKDEG